MNIRPQLVRAHAEEHPLHLVGQFLDHVRDHFQVARMARPTRPADTRLARLPAQGLEVAPVAGIQRVGYHADIAMHAGEGFGQRLRGDDKAVHIGQTTTYGAQNVRWHVCSVHAFERQIG
ncbi:hypothetical protein D3C80_1808190 [compost metagenome]